MINAILAYLILKNYYNMTFNEADINTVRGFLKEKVEAFNKENPETQIELTDNVDRIIKAKLRFFGIDNWSKCPCVQDGQHACISETCKQQILNKGICHCSLMKLKK